MCVYIYATPLRCVFSNLRLPEKVCVQYFSRHVSQCCRSGEFANTAIVLQSTANEYCNSLHEYCNSLHEYCNSLHEYCTSIARVLHEYCSSIAVLCNTRAILLELAAIYLGLQHCAREHPLKNRLAPNATEKGL